MLFTARKKFFKGFIQQQRNGAGFTLIELLIVIAILGILAAAVLVAVNPAKRQKQARDSTRKSDVGQLATALQAYFTAPGAGVYPAGNGAPGGLTALTASGDLKLIPTDPTGGAYNYTVGGAATDNAAIWTTLEDPTGASGFWCWQSSTGKAIQVVASASCTP